MSLTLEQLRAEAMLAIGGGPAVASQYAEHDDAVVAEDQNARIMRTINDAGRYLFGRPWGFRRLPTAELEVAADATYVLLGATVGEILPGAIKIDNQWSEKVLVVSADRFEEMRMMGDWTGVCARFVTVTRAAPEPGEGLGQRRLDMHPSPDAAETWRVRSLLLWPDDLTAATEGTYILPVPPYAEALLIEYVRAFAQGREDDGLSPRLEIVDNGPLKKHAMRSDAAEHPTGDNDVAHLEKRIPSGPRFAGATLGPPT